MQLKNLLRIKRKEPMGRFLFKALLMLSVLFAIGAYAKDRYRLGVETQADPCLPDTRIYLIDTYDRNPERGGIFSFSSQRMGPFYPDGTQILKIMDAVPGDHVTVSEEGIVKVNEQVVAEEFTLAETLKLQPKDLVRDVTIPEEKFWFSGRTKTSFDSRYWGYVDQTQLLGRAYPLY